MANERKVEMLKQIAEYYGITRNVDFARFFGLGEVTAFNRLKQGIIDYEEVYAKCPDISADWLLSGGEGPMLRADRDREIYERGGSQEKGEAGKNCNLEDRLKDAMDALTREQESLARSQEHISGLIAALNK